MDKKRKIQKIIKSPIHLYKPPYESIWFATEKNISLDAYLKQLFEIAKQYLKSNTNPDTIKGILVPHASVYYSGLCSASAYTQLLGRTNNIKRIILLCTNHQIATNSFISTSYTEIASFIANRPNLKIDTKTIDYLKPYLQIDDSRFKEEHSFYNQLPFIESIINAPSSQFVLLPFLISNSLNLLDEKIRYNIRKILNTILELLKNKDTILICTSDLSHINGDFEYKIKSNIFQNIRKKDNEILQFLYNGINGLRDRNQKLDDILFIQNAPSCGTMAIYFFAKLLNSYSGGIDFSSSGSSSSNSSGNNSPLFNKINPFDKPLQNNKLQLFPRVCCYYTSLIRDKLDIFKFNPLELNASIDITSILKSSVSYSGLIFTTQPYIEYRKLRKLENMFSQYEKIVLIGFIKEQIYNNFYNKLSNTMSSMLIMPINCQVFLQNLGIYVCVYKDNKLRSCIGTIDINNDDSSILYNAKQYAHELSFNKNSYKDMNFPKLEANELNKLTFEISILGNIKPISINEYFGNKFQFGNDGIFIYKGKSIDGKSIVSNTTFVLTSIKEPILDGQNKKTLLENLCQHNTGIKTCYTIMNDAKLFYNEGITLSYDSIF